MLDSDAADAMQEAVAAPSAFTGPDAHRVIALVLPLLPPDARQCAAATCRTWRAALAGAPDRWKVLDFCGCAVEVGDAALATLCARAGAALRELQLDEPACATVSLDGVLDALRNSGCTGLRRLSCLRATRSAKQVFSVQQALALAEHCPALEHAASRVACASAADAARVGSTLPGPLKLVLGRVDDVANAFAELQLLPSVVALELPAAWWQAAGAAVLASALDRAGEGGSVTSVDLSSNQIEDAGVRFLAVTLQDNKTLTNLDLTTNYIQHAGAAALADALRINSTLRVLVLNDNRLYDVGVAAIADALHVNTGIADLQLNGNGCGDAGAAAMAEALQVNRTLTSLELEGNGITPIGVALLSLALVVNGPLLHLSLANNPVEAAGAASLAGALRSNSTLQSLDIGGCSISDAGVARFSEALKTNASLQTLRLAMNDTSLTGATVLAQALSMNKTLTSLDLGSNPGIKDAGALEIADALQVNETLRCLNLARCHIDDLGAIVIGQALQGNYALSSLDLSYNTVTDVGGAAVIDAWTRDDATLLRLDLRNNKHSAAGSEALLVQASSADGTVTEPLRPRLFAQDGAHAYDDDDAGSES